MYRVGGNDAVTETEGEWTFGGFITRHEPVLLATVRFHLFHTFIKVL
jgi:hypothetical protein